VTELDGQEAALRAGLMPGAQGWNPPIASRVTIHRGTRSLSIQQSEAIMVTSTEPLLMFWLTAEVGQ